MRYLGYYIIIVLALLFILFVLFPNLTIYRHKVIYKNFRIYSDKEIDGSIHQILDEVEKKLSCSEIYNDHMKYRMYLSSSIKLYAVFVPGQKDAFAAAFPIFKNIFVSQTDVKNNKVYRNSVEDNERSLSSVLAHEAVHILIEKKIGIGGNCKLTTWKKEGYCEYISVDEPLNMIEAFNTVYSPGNQSSSSFSYLRYRLLVTYLLEEKGYSFQEMVETEFDLHQLETELRDHFRISF
ncbi:MAG: hypothetical protein K8R49_02755 [Candidatus Cloacimonetes bacterium]|nr:hypothetical protein [Candidatus Cloacimonadota bacterium]